jgi:hypothetical protein
MEGNSGKPAGISDELMIMAIGTAEIAVGEKQH